MDTAFLEDIGLSHNEASIYLALLETGLATASEIAKKSRVHRTNVYDVLERLIEKGLVSYITRYKTKYFEASPPDNLMRYIKEKEDALKKAIPQLKLIGKIHEKKGEAHIFEGVKAFMNILYGFLEQKEEILAYGIPKEVVGDFLKFEIPHFHKVRIEKKIWMKHIYNHDALKRIEHLNKMKYTCAGFLPKIYDTEVSTIVCGDEVVLQFWIKPPMMIQIKNEKIAEAYRQYFNLLWDLSKKPGFKREE